MLKIWVTSSYIQFWLWPGLFREASISEIFLLLSRTLSFLYFIVICLILYLIKFHNSLLSITSLNSSNHKSTLSFISATESSYVIHQASIKLPVRGAVFWFVYAVKMEKKYRMVWIYRRNDIGLLSVVLAYSSRLRPGSTWFAIFMQIFQKLLLKTSSLKNRW